MFRLQEPLADREQQLLANLRQWMADQSALCVAYSGGVDSTLVAAMAYEAQGDAALAVTGVSPAWRRICCGKPVIKPPGSASRIGSVRRPS